MELTLAPMAKDFLPYSIDQRLLLPPDMRDWLPQGHLALFAHHAGRANKGSFVQGYNAHIAVDGEAQSSSPPTWCKRPTTSSS